MLADAASGFEEGLIRGWVERQATGVDVITLRSSRRPRSRSRTERSLPARLQRGDNPLVVPVRVVWLAREHHGRRTASWADVARLGDPRDPDALRQRAIHGLYPERVRLVVGEGAHASELIDAHSRSVEVSTLADFVTRRAHLALERAERKLRGNRYKIPKFLAEEIVGRSDFADGVSRIASEVGIPPDVARNRAKRYLKEIAASHSPFLIDLIANAIHWLYRQGYGAIVYDTAQVQDIASISQEHPVAFLPSHRSNLDRLALQYLLWENDLPPNHTAAGVNMNFFPVGPLIRRTGAFFIRRSFKDNPLYKFVLRSYLDYLIEKRFPLEWYTEGGRSRSGKLLPPKYGMLGWVVDAVRRGKAEDLYLIPTSIAYDQIQDVGDYASEATGAEKQKESFSWAWKAIKSLKRRYGNIHVRFAEPISINKELEGLMSTSGDEVTLDLQKLAFEIMFRIGNVTPITPTAVVSIALLSVRGHATPEELATRCEELDSYIETRGFPTTEPLRLEDPRYVYRILEQLHAHGSVSRSDRGTYWLNPSQAHQAGYYRNTVVHFFVPGAVAELALMKDSGDVTGFWEEVFRIRDLLKFEFFFPDRESFVEMITRDLDYLVPAWKTDPGRHLVARIRPLRAHWAILPFLEAYQVVADELCEAADREIVQACLERGKRYRQEGITKTDEGVSKALFSSALALADNRGLVDSESREAFCSEVTDVRLRATEIAGMAGQATS